jgi:tRNA(adenine34) deaminase
MTEQKLNHEQFMRIALNQAELALMHNEIPIGCIIVDKEEKIIGLGHNAPIMLNDPTAHAEINSLRQACLHQKNYRLTGCTVYVTLEPCMMCTGALLQARVEKIIIAAKDTRAHSIHKQLDLFQSSFFNHRIHVEYGYLEERAKELIDNFFKGRR